MIKAHEIQGVLALENSFNRVGLDHVVLVKVASTAVVAHMLGLSRDEIVNAVSLAWVDGQSLRTYRHAPNTGSRKSWAAGDATARAVRLALIARTGEMGYPSVLSAKTWGFYDVLFKGQPFRFQRPYSSYVMEHGAVQDQLSRRVPRADRRRMRDATASCGARPHRRHREDHHPHARVGDPHHRQAGPLDNPADRDHCIQYMVAVPMIFGRLTAADYEDTSPPIRASTRCARRWCASRTSSSRATTSTPTSARSPTASPSSSRTARARRGRRRVPDRPPRRRAEGMPVLDREVQDQPRAPLRREAAAGDPRRRRSIPRGSRHAGARVRRPHDALTGASMRTRLSPSPASRSSRFPRPRRNIPSSSRACGRSTRTSAAARPRRHDDAICMDERCRRRCRTWASVP
jgi:2-methylcitrate dehydratase